MPAEAEGMIKHEAADLTSRSLRGDATSGSLRDENRRDTYIVPRVVFIN